jgi:putative MFS transporter
VPNEWDLWSLLFFRFLLGVGVGMDFPVALSFIAEFTNSQTKGKYVNLWQAMWYIAAASTGLFALPLYFIGVGDDLWRWAVGLGAVPALIILILRLIYIDESLMWAAHRQGLREAANILEKKLRRTRDRRSRGGGSQRDPQQSVAQFDIPEGS